MARDMQLPEPAAELLRVSQDVTETWLRRTMRAVVVRAGVGDDDAVGADIDRVATVEARRLLAELADLLGTDVDEQRTNPLSVFRRAVVREPTALLRSLGVRSAPPDDFAAGAFPDDVYRLGPATWGDIDPALHDPGLAWGAWKAMTVLQRRRAEGRR